MDKNQTISFLKNKNFNTSKKMGQNFLINDAIKNKIIDNASASVDDLIIEIGPGLGAITEKIINKNFNLLAIELDKRLFKELDSRFSHNPKFKIINSDVLKLDLIKVINENYPNHDFKQNIIISNLPYSVSSQIIGFIAINKVVSKSIIMVQKEMAQRLTAKVDTKKYNSFSAWISLIANVDFLFDVSPNNFVPKPNVMSSVIKIEFNNKYTKEELDKFRKFLFECFKNRRKTLFNNLLTIYPKNNILDALKNMDLSPTIRAQELSGESLIKLLTILEKSR